MTGPTRIAENLLIEIDRRRRMPVTLVVVPDEGADQSISIKYIYLTSEQASALVSAIERRLLLHAPLYVAPAEAIQISGPPEHHGKSVPDQVAEALGFSSFADSIDDVKKP